MNAEVKEKWLEALRSGEYTQARGQLAKDGGHCCLGVLCEVAIKQGVIPTYGPYSAGLPEAIQQWADLSGLPDLERPLAPDSDLLELNAYTNELAVLNDDGATFIEIADLIEKYL